MLRFNKHILLSLMLLVLCVTSACIYDYQQKIPLKISGSFHISQFNGFSWIEKYDEPFTVQYQTKVFPLTPIFGSVKVQIVQKTVSYGDIDLIELHACGNIIQPEYARYVNSGASVIDDIYLDDHNVAINHENPIELSWSLPHGCMSPVYLVLKANEYESPVENAFRFPDWDRPFATYYFSKNGTFKVDGKLEEVDGVIEPQFKPFWEAGTGHPSNNTLIYIMDDENYVYIGADVLLDNSNEFGQDWIKVIAHNTKNGNEKEFKVDDYDDTYGTCAFGVTSKVSYRHQTCEIRLPKNEFQGNYLNFILRYYGTGGAPDPVLTIQSLSYSTPTGDTTPSITGTARATNGAAAATSVTYGLADNTGLSEGNVIANYDGTCTANDGAFDETTEPFTCTLSTLTAGTYRLFLYTTNGSQTDTDNSVTFTLFNNIFTSQINEDYFNDVTNEGIDAFVSYNNNLYVGTNSSGGTQVWAYDGDTWTQVNVDGFGDSNNYGSYVMQVYNNKLYVGTNNQSTGTEIWEYDGNTWTQVNTNGFGVAVNYITTSLGVYNSELIAVTLNNDTGQSSVRAYNGSSWELLDAGAFEDLRSSYPSATALFESKIFFGMSNGTTAEVWSYDGNTWTQVNTDGFGDSDNETVMSLVVHDNLLYAGTRNANSGGQIWSYDGDTWTQIETNTYWNSNYAQITSLNSYNDELYASTRNESDGAVVWKYTGSAWERVSYNWIQNGIGSGNYDVRLTSHKGRLYAGTTSLTQVWEANTDTDAPSITLTPISDPTSDTTPSITGTTSDNAGAHVSAIEFQVDGTGGSWTACTADDGTFDEADEGFSCTVVSALSAGGHTINVRATDSNDNTTANGSVSSDTFTISSAPTSTPDTSSNSTQSTDSPQIPQGQSHEVGGVFQPIKDSFTGGQTVSVIVESGTFDHDAYLSSVITVPPTSSGLLTNILSQTLTPSALGGNIIVAGGEGGKLGIKQSCGITWQVGNIQQMWYKTYPPKGTNVAPAVIIPELQHRASIVALSFTFDDLTPPGQPHKKFSTKRLKLAHSLDGVHWSMLPTSVVDQENRTVAALDKVGGYYMIVAGCQGGTSSGVSLGVSTTPLQKTSPVSNQKLPIKATPAQPTYAVTPQQKIVKQKTNQNPSLLQRVSAYIQNLF